MPSIDIAVLVVFMASAIIIALIGFLMRPRIPFLMMISGIIWFILFLGYDKIDVGHIMNGTKLVNVTQSIAYSDPSGARLKLFFAMFGVIMMVASALETKFGE